MESSSSAAATNPTAPVIAGAPGLGADPRIVELERLVDSGAYDVLSLDVFDTLVWRAAPRPTDAFFLLADALRDTGALWPSSSRESFVLERTEAEARARRAAASRETTLARIWQEFPSGYLRDTTREAALALELEIERRLVHPHADVVALARRAQARGMRVALVSDTYFDAAQLAALTGGIADAVFASADHGVNKYQGLHGVLLRALGVAPERVLHVGDDPRADVEGPRALRIATFHLAKFPEAYAELLARELPATFGPRSALLAADDAGLTALRGRALAHAGTPDACWGAGVLGPILSGFADWVIDRCGTLGATQALCLMREGRLLKQVLDARGTPLATHECFMSRYVALKAAILDGTAEEIAEFVRRPSPVPRGRLVDQLGLAAGDVPGDPDELLSPAAARALAEQLAANGALRRGIVASSAASRRGLLAHVDALLGGAARGVVAVVDLGYKGTIQACLQRIFSRERPGLETHGLYLVTGGEVHRTQAAGTRIEGWLASNGQPLAMAHTFMRAPEIVEQSLMADVGTTLGHRADGTPILDTPRVDATQRAAVAEIQHGVRRWAQAWCAHRAALGIADTQALEPLVRSIAIRAIARPLPIELELFGGFTHDENFGSEAARTLTSAVGLGEWELSHASAHQLASLPHAQVYWPFGLAARQSPELAEAVAALYLRAVPAEVFERAGSPRRLAFYWDTGAGFHARQCQVVDYALNHRGRSWQRFALRLEGGPLVRLGLSIGLAGEALRLAGVRLHRRQRSGVAAIDSLGPDALGFDGYRRLTGALWLVERDPPLVEIPAAHVSGLNGDLEVDVFFSIVEAE